MSNVRSAILPSPLMFRGIIDFYKPFVSLRVAFFVLESCLERVMDKLRIIIYEDDPALANLLRQALTSAGHTVQTFTDPTICPVYKEHRGKCPKDKTCADVIISDYMMPEMTGVDYFRLQKKRGCKALTENKALITGSAMHADLKQAIDDLGCHYIKKPFKLVEVLTWVEKCAKRLHQ